MSDPKDTPRRDSRKLSYIDKLKDPRWQKMRLQILERDKWQCAICLDTRKTLHIHHRYYLPGREPWEYEGTALVTLCEDCHAAESEERSCAEHDIILAFKRAGFFANDISAMVLAFASLEGEDISMLPDAISWMIEDRGRREKMILDCTNPKS